VISYVLVSYICVAFARSRFKPCCFAFACVFRVNLQEIDNQSDTQKVESMCHPCTRLFINKRLKALNRTKNPTDYDEMDRLTKLFPSLCAKNPAGERCGALAVKNLTTGTSYLDQISMFGCPISFSRKALLMFSNSVRVCRGLQDSLSGEPDLPIELPDKGWLLLTFPSTRRHLDAYALSLLALYNPSSLENS